MKPLSVSFLFFLILVSPCQPLMSQDGGIISLNGTWQMHQQGSKKIYNAEVPGIVHTDLERNKVIADPFYATYEEKTQWISDTGWVYERYFELDRTFFVNRNIQLVCEGLDTYANVYINDSLVLTADNMFKSWYAPIKRYLYAGFNKIRIEFPSIDKLDSLYYSNLPIPLPGGERVVTRKAAYQYGWDFAPRFPTMGIWGPIYIKYWQNVNLLGVNMIQKSLSDSLARMTASFVLSSALSDSAEFILSFDSTVFFSGKELLAKGVNPIRIDFDMTNPKRWWPNGMGAPILYTISYEVRFLGKTVVTGEKRFGLRTVELIREPDSVGESFFFKVNGKPVFIRGANYVPMDMFPSRVSDSMYRELITNADNANINMLRVWGGGIYEKDVLYDLCDEKGIMVWQDFMFANGMYPSSKEFLSNIRGEIIQQIVRLRDHPSIVLWCGNNEIDEGWRNWGWMEEFGYDREDSVKLDRTYRQIFQDLIPWAVKRYDTLRPYVHTSPQHGWGREISLKEGDMHYWGVWWGDEPFSVYEQKTGRFMSEYGFQGFPDYATIEAFTRPADRVLGSAVLKAHQKHPTGFEKIDAYMRQYYEPPKDLKMYAYVSQLLQADGIKTAIEAHRRAKPRCMGTMFWQLNDPWPGITWSARDYYGRKKALWYTISRSYRDFFVSPVMEGDQLKVYATFDEPDNQKAILRVVLADLDGLVLWEYETEHNFSAAMTETIVDTNLSHILQGQDKANLFLYAQIANILGIRASNTTFLVPPKELALQKAPIDITITPDTKGYVIHLYTKKLAKGVRLSTTLPGTFSDNYFDLLPFEDKQVTFETPYRSGKIYDLIEVISLIDAYPER